MELLQCLLGHDLWTSRQLFERCLELPGEELDREFDIGHRSIRETASHIVRNVEAWSWQLAGNPISQLAEPSSNSMGALVNRLQSAHERLANAAGDVADRDVWNDVWLDRTERPPVSRSFGGTIAHVITHSMHHRAQLLYLMRLCGLKNLPEGDVLSWEQHRTIVE